MAKSQFNVAIDSEDILAFDKARIEANQTSKNEFAGFVFRNLTNDVIDLMNGINTTPQNEDLQAENENLRKKINDLIQENNAKEAQILELQKAPQTTEDYKELVAFANSLLKLIGHMIQYCKLKPETIFELCPAIKPYIKLK